MVFPVAAVTVRATGVLRYSVSTSTTTLGFGPVHRFVCSRVTGLRSIYNFLVSLLSSASAHSSTVKTYHAFELLHVLELNYPNGLNIGIL